MRLQSLIYLIKKNILNFVPIYHYNKFAILRWFPTAATSYSDGFTKVIVLGVGNIYSDSFSNCRTNRCNYYSVGYKPSQSEKRKINYFTLSRRFETAAIVCFDIASVSNRRYPFFLVFFL
jgi:hypothetical protein